MEFKIEILKDSVQLLDISDEEYFGPDYKNYISNSRLGKIDLESDDLSEFLGNWNTLVGDFLVIGSAVHGAILQPEDFEIVDDDTRPSAKLGLVADEIFNYVISKKQLPNAKDIMGMCNKCNYYKSSMTEDKALEVLRKCQSYLNNRVKYRKNNPDKEGIFLDPKTREKCNIMIANLTGNREAMSILNPETVITEPVTENEFTILANIKVTIGDKSTILPLKAKLDNFTIDYDTNTVCLNDLKTTGKDTSQFEGSWNNFHYFRQQAMYTYLLLAAVEKFYNIKNPTLKSNFLIVSSRPPHNTRVWRATKGDAIKGFDEFCQCIKKIATYKINNNDRLFE